MSDREKVLNDLQELCEHLFHEYKVCYKGDEEDTYNRFLAANNALNLLKKQPRWISVEDRLPENAKHLGAFCPRYYVQTEFGMTEGWYNPDRGKWYVLLWFIYAKPDLYIPRFVDLEHGDIPLVSDKVEVSHWMPLPEPPEEVKQDDHA